jgi:hypothetical protein
MISCVSGLQLLGGIGAKWRDAYVDVAFDNPKRKTAAATATSIRLKGRSL